MNIAISYNMYVMTADDMHRTAEELNIIPELKLAERAQASERRRKPSLAVNCDMIMELTSISH